MSADDLYNGWRESLEKRYARFKDRDEAAGDLVRDLGMTDYYPAVSPDGRWLAWLSSRDKDYNILDLMLTEIASGKTRKLVDGVDYRVSWSQDSVTLVYVRRPERSPRYYDIYTYDIASGAERRLSKGLRARDPAFSPDGESIVFVRNEGGNNALALMEK